MKKLLICVCCLAVSPPVVAAESLAWPQFRGLGGSGVADDQHPPVEIGPDKNVQWKVAAPPGASSPIVVGDLLVLTAFEDDKLLTIAYRRADGSEAWRTEAPYEKLEPYHPTEGSPAASTPATDGQHIVSYFGSCGLFCYDLTGKELWRHTMAPAATIADFGSGVSPIIVDGKAVLLHDEKNAPLIVAVDMETGAVAWETKRTSISGFGSPTAWSTDDGMQIAAPGYGRLIGYDAATGKEKWFVSGMPSSGCTTPLVDDGILYYAGWAPGAAGDAEGFNMPSYDDLLKMSDKEKDGVFSKEDASTTPFANFFDNNDPNKDGVIDRTEWEDMINFQAQGESSAFALKPGGEGDCTKSHVAWKQNSGLPYVPTAILYKGQFVMVKDGGIVTAYDASNGKRIYQKRAVAGESYYASPVAANGNIYFASLNDGTVTVLKAGTDKPEVVAKNPPLGERVSATPAIADDTLYVRTEGHLYAFKGE